MLTLFVFQNPTLVLGPLLLLLAAVFYSINPDFNEIFMMNENSVNIFTADGGKFIQEVVQAFGDLFQTTEVSQSPECVCSGG